MNWEEKAVALSALSEISLKMRKPGDWYVSHRVEVLEGCVLAGRYGSGSTPEEAIENHWDKLTTQVVGDQCVVVDAGNKRRKHFRWNGFMWWDVPENQS